MIKQLSAVFKKTLIMCLMLITVLTALFVLNASAKQVVKLATPKFTYAKVSENTISFKWSKIKGAKGYRFYQVTTKKVWKYAKKVKKTKANKKKFADKNKYKLVVSGKYYKVYVKASEYVYTRLRTTDKCAYTFKGKYTTAYSFTVKAFNGNKVSKLAKIYSTKTGKKKTKPAVEKPVTEPVIEPVQKTESKIIYELDGGINNSDNPGSYIEGEKIVILNPTKQNYIFEGWFLDKEFTKPLPDDTSTLKGELSLFAKWKEEIIIPDSFENMIWSWWYYPQAVSFENIDGTDLFWGYATNEGYCGVAKLDSKSGILKKTNLKQAAADDHNGLALTLLDDNRIMAAYAGGHNTDKFIHIRISDKPLDNSSFSTDIVLESAGKTCYSQIIKSSGRYYLFYRVNNSSWAYRYSTDCISWSDEVILIQSGMQYYCRFNATTIDNIIRILMYSNPSGTATEIRMGFFDTQSNSVYDGSGYVNIKNGVENAAILQGKLPSSNNAYSLFQTILEPPEGKTQRLFDCALTKPENPEFLFAAFSKKLNSNDSVYYLFESGSVHTITEGGKPLMDYKYQLGASFIDAKTIIASSNADGFDTVALYSYDGASVNRSDTLDIQVSVDGTRNARPIADCNSKAVLWHNGYYNNTKYTDFNTSARICLLDSMDSFGLAPDGTNYKVNIKNRFSAISDNVAKVNSYAEKLYNENKKDDYRYAQFTWSQEQHKRGWLYYNGLMLESFLMTDPEKYSEEILNFYDRHVVANPSASEGNSEPEFKVWSYVSGELDWALPATGMIDCISLGLTEKDGSGTDRTRKYCAAVNYVFQELERQTRYDDAGGLLQHSEREQNGLRVPTKSWEKWNVCLDGVYMSNLFLIRLARAIDSGIITVKSIDGSIVKSADIWEDVFERMIFVTDNFKDTQSSLLFHGYSIGEKQTNGVVWGRGMGWFSMAMLEAAEFMPDSQKREVLQSRFRDLMTAAIKWQDTSSSLWYNVMNKREEVPKNQPETSGSSMLAYCLLRGYESGVLNSRSFEQAGLSAFNALVQNKLSEDGLTDTLIGMGVSAVENAYQNNRFVTNEAKGIAGLIMASKYVH